MSETRLVVDDPHDPDVSPLEWRELLRLARWYTEVLPGAATTHGLRAAHRPDPGGAEAALVASWIAGRRGDYAEERGSDHPDGCDLPDRVHVGGEA